MACPHFDPVQPHTNGASARAAMLPLGDIWRGVCRAGPGATWDPDEDSLRTYCNLGYARGNCARFPGVTGPDAVRFAITGEDGVRIRVLYVVERDHHPFAHGPLEFSLADSAFVNPPVNPTFGHQARAYVTSYLRRKREASGHGAASRES